MLTSSKAKLGQEVEASSVNLPIQTPPEDFDWSSPKQCQAFPVLCDFQSSRTDVKGRRRSFKFDLCQTLEHLSSGERSLCHWSAPVMLRGESSEDSVPQHQCARCRAQIATISVRNERLCQDCFQKYVSSKVLKRFESSRIRAGYNQVPKRILLVTVCDISSICLCDVTQQLRRRRLERHQDPGYTVHVLYVDESIVCGDLNAVENLETIRRIFPDHSCDIIRLEELGVASDLSESILQDQRPSLQDLHDPRHILQHAVSSLKSTSSKVDFVEKLRNRLVETFAAREKFDHIMYSDSTTRLAERILAETAKGRGGSLLALTDDHATADGIPCLYPMRDILEQEIHTYAETSIPTMLPVINMASAKRAAFFSDSDSIDGLMAQYFSSVEIAYPSIVANVVRTSHKLVVDSNAISPERCNLCQTGLQQKPEQRDVNANLKADQNRSINGHSIAHDLCTACKETLNVGSR